MSRFMTGVRKAAQAAGRRMAALEEQADAIHAKTLLSCTARVVSTQEGGVHALITDHHGVTMEIAGGEVAVAVAQLIDLHLPDLLQNCRRFGGSTLCKIAKGSLASRLYARNSTRQRTPALLSGAKKRIGATSKSNTMTTG
jgi:hypothetical protein